MKLIKKIGVILSLCLAIILTTPNILPYNTVMTVEAASVKLNKSKLTLYVGDTSKLKLKRTSKKINWSSTRRSVATVSKSGKVTAKKFGKTDIKAVIRVNGRKRTYTCKVTVKKAKKNSQISFEKAKQIALKKVGGGFVTDIDLDYEFGRLVYEIEVYYNGLEYDVYIDAYTGKVLLCKIDY